MKILHTADNHANVKKINEFSEAFQYILKVAESERPDLIIQAGDLFDKNMLINSEAFRTAYQIIFQLAQIAPLIIIRGNHDPENSLNIFRFIDANYPIYVFEKNQFRTINLDEKKVEIVAIPYMKRGDFEINSGLTASEAEKLIADKIAEWLQSLPEPKHERFIVGHLTVSNVNMANNQTIFTGEPIFQPETLMIPKPTAVFLGHIHKHTQPLLEKYPIRYANAHYYTNFGETDKPGFWIWDNGNWIRYDSPVKENRMITIRANQIHNLEDIILQNKDANLKIRVEMTEQEEMELPEIEGIIIEKRKIPTHMVRNTEIIKYNRLAEKFTAYAKDNGIDVNNQIIEILEELENAEKVA